MNVQEIIDILSKIEDKSKEIRILSADHSNDSAQDIYEEKEVVYICG